MHLADAFEAAARQGPGRPFIVSADRRLTYAQADTESQALAAALADLGIVASERIALILPNWPEWVTTLLAAARLGCPVVPINPALGWHELKYQVRHAGAHVAVVPQQWQGREFAELLDELFAESPDLRYVVCVGDDDAWYDERVLAFAELVGRGRRMDPPARARDAAEPLAILFTSGTMGKPKGAVLSHEAVLWAAGANAKALEAGADDVSLLAVPCFTIFGASVVAGAVATGSALVMVERFDAAMVAELLAREQVTQCHGVPTMFHLLLRESEFTRERLPRLKTGLVAGAPVPPALLERVRAVCDVEVAYGLTETGPTIALTRKTDPAARRLDSVGRPAEGAELRLVALERGDGTPEVPHEQEAVGELAVRSPGLMLGYDRMPAETRRSFTPEGFFLTGDLAQIDAAGYVRIVGRKKELIIRGGFSVVPREVEDVLRAHPAVEEVCVVGVPHDVLGEQVCACVVPVEGAIVQGEDMRSFAREHLADYKVPDLVRFMGSLPLTASGKVKRRELAQAVALELAAS